MFVALEQIPRSGGLYICVSRNYVIARRGDRTFHVWRTRVCRYSRKCVLSELFYALLTPAVEDRRTRTSSGGMHRGALLSESCECFDAWIAQDSADLLCDNANLSLVS